MRAALYIRVSTEEQAEEGYSIPAQIKALNEYAYRQEWDVVATYVEDGASGRSDKRPRFQQMIRDAKEKPRPFDVIVVHKMDRFARNRKHSVVYKEMLRRELGIQVTSMTEQFGEGPAGRLSESIMEAIAEFYSDNLGAEVLKGQRERATTGRGMCVPPIGYSRCHDKDARDDRGRELYGRHVPDPETAPIVRWIFVTYTNGQLGMAAIAKTLKEEGTSRFGPAAARFSWTVAFIRKILDNRAYIGELIWGQRDTRNRRRMRPEDEWVVVPDAHEPLVEVATWEKAQEIRTGRRNTNTAREGKDYLLRGLVRCMECGRNMIRFNYQWLDKRTGEKVYRPCVICTGYTRHHECYCNRVPMADIEAGLFNYLRDLLAGNVGRDQIKITPKIVQKDKTNPVADLKKRIDAEKRKLEKAYAAYLGEARTLEQYKADKVAIEAGISALEAQLSTAEIAATTIPDVDSDQVLNAISEMIASATDESLPLQKRRDALKTVVEAVLVSRRLDRMELWIRV